MKIGVPTEIKSDEYRVAITPAGVRKMCEPGHEVLIQAGAGEGSAISDERYTLQGARIVADAAAVFAEAEMILHVKELQPSEIAMLRPEQLLFTYLHLAPDPEQTSGLIESGVTAGAYETVEDAGGRPAARADGVGGARVRLGGGGGRGRRPAVAGADERGGGEDRHPGGRLHAAET